MSTHPLREQPETVQETLLRATLQEHAPQTVDLEQDWETVSCRLASLHDTPQPVGRLQYVPRELSRPGRNRKRWPLLGAVAVLFVTLLVLGTAFVGPLSGRFGSEGTTTAYAFSPVNQSQQSAGIQIMVGKAYADPERLYIAYTVQLSRDLLRDYGCAFVVAASEQGSYGPVVQVQTTPSGLCQLTASTSSPLYSLNKLGPLPDLFHVPSHVNTVVITWTITEVKLQRVPWSAHKSTPLLIHGSWHFQFSIPFYHQEHDPAMPFPLAR